MVQVRVFRLVTESTVEERIVERAEMKLKLDALVIQSGQLAQAGDDKVSGKEILSMIQFGAEKMFKSTPPLHRSSFVFYIYFIF